MENLDVIAFLILGLVLVHVNPKIREFLRILIAICAGIAGMLILGLPYMIFKFYMIWARYQRELAAEEAQREWAHACSQYVYRRLFKPTPPPVARKSRVGTPLFMLLLLAIFIVGLHTGRNT